MVSIVENKSPEIDTAIKSEVVADAVDKKELLNTPNILSSTAIRAALIKEEKNRRKDKVELNAENLNKFWFDYLENHNSKGVKSALKNVKLLFEDKTIFIHVPTLFIKEIILQESELMEILRTSFLKEGIIIMVEVNKNEFPEYEEASAYVQKLNSKEVFEKMNSKNPLLQELVKKIGLKPID